MTQPVEAVLFDIDGTICEYRRDIPELLSAAFERADTEPFFSASDYKRRFNEFTDVSEDMIDLRERCFAAIARERDKDPAVGHKVARAYAVERDHSNVEFLDGVRETLETLSESYRLAAVTNGAPEMQSTKLDALDVDCFETVVYAGYDTPAKPDPEPFQVALDAVETPPRQAVYIGDSLRADIAGAQAAGLRTVWLGTDADPEPQPEFVLESPAKLRNPPWEK